MVCIRKCFDELSEYISEGIQVEGENIEEILRRYMECRIEFFKKYPYYKKIFHTAVFNAPPHLTEEIEESRKRLHQVNELFLEKVISDLTLKENVNKADLIRISIDFGNYLLSKYKGKNTLEENFMEELVEEFIQMMRMLFYGVVREN